MDKMHVALLIQTVATLMLMGMVWFMQIVHYPLYEKIKEGFVQYERSHLKRMAAFMGPMMIIEAITAVQLVTWSTEGIVARLAVTNIIFVITIWLWTLFFQVYQHQKLAIHFSNKMLHYLVSTNWVRTILWTAKGALIIALLAHLI